MQCAVATQVLIEVNYNQLKRMAGSMRELFDAS